MQVWGIDWYNESDPATHVDDEKSIMQVDCENTLDKTRMVDGEKLLGLPADDSEGQWVWRRKAWVWVHPTARLCNHDKKYQMYFCINGPGCQYCYQLDQHEELASTVTPGSAWESPSDWDKESTSDVNTKTQLNYQSLPLPKILDEMLGRYDPPYDVISEVERAKQHPQFQDFMQWLINEYQLPGDHVWGGPEEPVEDLLDFVRWLISTGRGKHDEDLEGIVQETPKKDPGIA